MKIVAVLDDLHGVEVIKRHLMDNLAAEMMFFCHDFPFFLSGEYRKKAVVCQEETRIASFTTNISATCTE